MDNPTAPTLTIPKIVSLATLGAAGWRTHTLMDLNSDRPATAVVVFDFDAGGAAAVALADRCIEVHRRDPQINFYTQSGVFAVLSERGFDMNAVVNIDDVVRSVIGSDSYVTTSHVAAALKSLVGDDATCLILAHGAHATRCVAACVREGLDLVIDLNAIHSVPWNTNSQQIWTRGNVRALAWWPRETLLLHRDLLSLARRAKRRCRRD